jgi:hypothetical protein
MMSAFGRYLDDKEGVGEEESADEFNTACHLTTYEAIYGPSESYAQLGCVLESPRSRWNP